MIKYVSGDLLQSNADAIVNTVNCVGVMGRGIALQFKRSYPDNFTAYAKMCKREEVVPGKMFVFSNNRLVGPKYIINFPTKRHWRGAARIEDIKAGLSDLVSVIQKYDIMSIALPPLGCGLGGLKWAVVKSCIESALSILSSVQIDVYEPNGAPSAAEMVKNLAIPKITSGRAALVSLVKRYLDGLLDPFVTLLEIHKLMYFLQECGEPLHLNYVKAHYGPYAENLSHVLKTVEGHLLSGYADGGDKPDKQIQLVPGAVEEAMAFLKNRQDTIAHINRVSDLVEGFETPFGLELLATVHWVVMNNSTNCLPDVTAKTYAWGTQKNKFRERQIEIAYRQLTQNGFLPTK